MATVSLFQALKHKMSILYQT